MNGWAFEYSCGCVVEWVSNIEGSGFSGLVTTGPCVKHAAAAYTAVVRKRLSTADSDPTGSPPKGT